MKCHVLGIQCHIITLNNIELGGIDSNGIRHVGLEQRKIALDDRERDVNYPRLKSRACISDLADNAKTVVLNPFFLTFFLISKKPKKYS